MGSEEKEHLTNTCCFFCCVCGKTINPKIFEEGKKSAPMAGVMCGPFFYVEKAPIVPK